MKKIIYILIPVIILVVSVLIMEGGMYLKKPRGEEDNVPKLVETVKNDVQNEKWDNVLRNTEKTKAAYKTVKKRIQFSVERDEVNRIDESLARIKGYALAKDKSGAMAELALISNDWEQLGQ